jgi:ABC-type lipoprotein release transport system permease subunit
VLVGAAAVGIAFQVPNTANILGYESEMLEQGVRGGFGDVRAYPRHGRRIDHAAAAVAGVRATPGVHGVAALLILPGVVASADDVQSVAVFGVDAPDGRRPYRIVEGEPLRPGDAGGVLLGRNLARRLRVRPGEKINLRVALGRDQLDDEIGRYSLTVRGILAGAFSICATDTVVVDRGLLARDVGQPDAADLLIVYSDDPDGAPGLAARLSAQVSSIDARTWAEDSALLRNAIHGSAAVAATSNALVLVAVALPLAALLYVRSVHRRRQIALMSAMGVGAPEIFIASLLQALMVGIPGILLGCPIGYALIRYFQAHPIFAMDEFVLRPIVALRTFVWPSAVVLFATLVAGLIPALHAARLDPADVLRRNR